MPIFSRIEAPLQMAPLTCSGRARAVCVRAGAREGRRGGGHRGRLPRRFDGAALANHQAGQGRRGGAAIAAVAAVAAAGARERRHGGCLGGFVGKKDAHKQKILFSRQRDELEGHEINAYLCNGGDSDPAEATVGKLSISRIDSTIDMCNMSGGGIRAPDFQSCNGTFLSEIMMGTAGTGAISQELRPSRGRRDNPRTAHIQEKRFDPSARAADQYVALWDRFCGRM